MILFLKEEVQHEENDERDPGKQESRQNDCQFRLLFFLLRIPDIWYLGWNFSSHGTYEYEDQDDRL